MVGVHEVRPAPVLGDHLAVQVHESRVPTGVAAAASIGGHHVARKIVYIIGLHSSYHSTHAPPVDVITIGGRAAAIDFRNTILGVVGVAVAGVVSHVAGGVVLEAAVGDVIVAEERLETEGSRG